MRVEDAADAWWIGWSVLGMGVAAAALIITVGLPGIRQHGRSHAAERGGLPGPVVDGAAVGFEMTLSMQEVLVGDRRGGSPSTTSTGECGRGWRSHMKFAICRYSWEYIMLTAVALLCLMTGIQSRLYAQHR